MDKATWDKLAAAGGIIGVVLFVIAIFVQGQPPDLGDDATTVANFFKDNRDQVLWAVFLQGLGVLAILWFIAALVTAMRDAGEARLATAAAIAFVLSISIGGVAALSTGALAFSIAGDADPGITLSFFHLSSYMNTVSGVIGAGLYFAVAGAIVRTRLLASWWGWLSGLAGLWAIVSGTAWSKHHTFWSPDKAGFISFIVFLVWVGVTSILLTMKMRSGGSTAAA